MHLHSLTLTNVRQFDQRTFQFHPGFNLLVGENGAGKTTLLRGLLAALGSTRQMGRRPRLEDGDIRLRARHAKVTAAVRYPNNRLEEFSFQKALLEPAKRSGHRRNLPLTLLYSSNEATCSAMKMKRARRMRELNHDPVRSSEEFLYAFERDFVKGSAGGSRRLFGSSRSVRTFVGDVLSTFSPEMKDFSWRFDPYDCVLVFPENAEVSSLLDAETQKQARSFALRKFHESQTRKTPFDWPDQAKLVLTPDNRRRDPRDRYLPDLRELWSEMKISSDAARRFLSSCSLEVRLTPRIMIQRRIGTLTLDQLSDGEQRLFSLFVDIARQLSINGAIATLRDGEAIVLIDEIDVHLHPKWQRRIVPALEDLFPNCQFIATTHSPFVIQATSRERITSIEPHLSARFLDGGNTIDDIAEEIQGVPVPQRSIRAEILSSAAEQYFTLLKMQAADPQSVNPATLRSAEASYRKASEPFTSDAAIHAFINLLAMEVSAQ